MQRRWTWVALSLAAVQLVLIGLVTSTVANQQGPLSAAVALPIRCCPMGMAIIPDGKRLVVAGGSRLTLVDIATRTVVGEIGVGSASDIAISPDGRTAYTTGSTSTASEINVVDLRSGLIVRTIVPAGIDVASLIAVTLDGRRLIGTDSAGRKGVAVDVATGSTIPLFASDSYPTSPPVTFDGSRIYIPPFEKPGPVRVVDTATGVAHDVSGPDGISGLAMSPDGRSVYGFGIGGTVVIDTGTDSVRETIGRDTVPGDVVAHDGRHVFVLNSIEQTLEVRSLDNEEVAGAALGGSATDAVLSPDGSTLFVIVGESLLAFDVHAFA